MSRLLPNTPIPDVNPEKSLASILRLVARVLMSGSLCAYSVGAAGQASLLLRPDAPQQEAAFIDVSGDEVVDGSSPQLLTIPHNFREKAVMYISPDNLQVGGRQTFYDESYLHLGLRGCLSRGTQVFRDRSMLTTTFWSEIRGGRQSFYDESQLDLPEGSIHAGEQFFHDSSKLVHGGVWGIHGGTQQFEGDATYQLNSSEGIRGGVQIFKDRSRLVVTRLSAIRAGDQIFHDDSTYEAEAQGSIQGGSAIFYDRSRLRLNVDGAMSFGGSVALNDSAAFELLGHPATVDTVESLEFRAKAVVRNGAATDTALTVNPTGARQPFFNGRMEDGGPGKLSLVKDGRSTYYMAGENAIAYSGGTEVNDGVLAIRGVAPSAAYKTMVLNGGWLDLSELSTESAEQFILSGTHPERVVRASDDDLRRVAAGPPETLSKPMGEDVAEQGKFLVKTGPGKLILDAENHYIGATRVQEGILSFSKNEHLGQQAAVRTVVLEGGDLELTADLKTDRTIEMRTTGHIDTTDTNANWRSVLQDIQPRTLVKQGSGHLTFREESHLGSLVVESGDVSFLDRPKIRAAPGASAITLAGNEVSASLVRGLITATTAPAIESKIGGSQVRLVATQASATEAPLARSSGSANLELSAMSSQLKGSLDAGQQSRLSLYLEHGSVWTGAATQHDAGRIMVELVGSEPRWNLTGDSQISGLVNSGTVQFGAVDHSASESLPVLSAVQSDYSKLHIKGNYAGDGHIHLRTHVDGDRILSDRVVIEGDASGSTTLHVALNKTGTPRKFNSVSLVQVGGQADADSFKLAGGEITLPGSPFKHTLDAYGPGAHENIHKADWELDNTQWDYRLRIAEENKIGVLVPPHQDDKKTDEGEPVLPHEVPDASPPPRPAPPPVLEPPVTTPQGPAISPPAPPSTTPQPPVLISPEPPVTAPPTPDQPAPKPPKTRAKLVPQASAYLAAPRALHNYQAEITSTLHQQLRDDRERALLAPERAYDGYARVIGLAHTYRGNLDWASHGIDFGQKSQALQIGGTLLRKSLGEHTVTLGAAATLGTTSISTHGRPDQRASARFDTRDVALTAGVGHRNGFFLDGVAAIGGFDGKVKAGSRHPSAKPRGQSAGLSLAAGRTLRFDNGLVVQPQLQWQYQRLAFASITDKNQIDIKASASDSHTVSAGAHVAWPQAGGAWTPYAQAHLLTGWGGAPTVRLSGSAFDTGRAGQAAQLAVGAHAELGKSTSLHGALTGRTRLGDAGTSGVAGTLGVRYVF